MTRQGFVIAILSGLSLGASAQASPNLVINGGFETGDFSGWTQRGNTAYTGVETVDNSRVHSGLYSAAFGPVDSFGFISQTLSTVAGGHYTVSFQLMDGGGTPNGFMVDFGGVNLLSLIDAAQFGYSLFTYDVVASASASELSFGFRQDPNWMYLDDVSVTGVATPEPVTFVLLGAAIACTLIVRLIARTAH